MIQRSVSHFDQWRSAARDMLEHHVPPEEVIWNAPSQNSLFDEPLPTHQRRNQPYNVPPAFIPLAKKVSHYRDVAKWGLLYRVLWRLVHEEKNLLKITTDNDVMALTHMAKQVNRDAHKMKAFVRFREVTGEDNSYVAWHEPIHLITEYTAPFFARRFAAMKWSILTPDCCAHWNGEKLAFSEGVTRDCAPNGDEMEALWKTFYRNIFNPARIKMKMMKSEMPVKYWHTMPETALIPSMLEEADSRVKAMMKNGS